MNNQRVLVIVAVLIGIAALGAGVGSYLARQAEHGTEPPPGLMWPNPRQFPAVTLYNQAGKDVTASDFKGHWSLVFFGFTHCPDICPATLSVLNRVEQQLAEQGVTEAELKTVFISVDPRRDTPRRLNEYVSYFNEDFTGLSGKPEVLDTLTRKLGTVYHVGKPDGQGGYQVNHSASVFLFDPQARLVSVFTTPHKADAIAKRFLAIRQFIRQQQN